MRLRNHVLSCLEMATRTTDLHQRRAWLSFLVAGGGPTGVEHAGVFPSTYTRSSTVSADQDLGGP